MLLLLLLLLLLRCCVALGEDFGGWLWHPPRHVRRSHQLYRSQMRHFHCRRLVGDDGWFIPFFCNATQIASTSAWLALGLRR